MVVILKPKPMVEQANTLQDVVANANTAEREKERVMIAQQEEKERQAQPKAPELINGLGGSYMERLKMDRTIHIKMTLDKRPEVVFTGFWDGRLIQSAMNAIARQYRQRRVTATKM